MSRYNKKKDRGTTSVGLLTTSSNAPYKLCDIPCRLDGLNKQDLKKQLKYVYIYFTYFYLKSYFFTLRKFATNNIFFNLIHRNRSAKHSGTKNELIERLTPLLDAEVKQKKKKHDEILKRYQKMEVYLFCDGVKGSGIKPSFTVIKICRLCMYFF